MTRPPSTTTDPTRTSSTFPITTSTPYFSTAVFSKVFVNNRGCTWAVVRVVPIVLGARAGPSIQDGIFELPYGEEDPDSVMVMLRVVKGQYPYDSGPLSSSESERWRLKLARASDSTGPPSHQSRARNPPAFPEAAQATEDFSTRVTAAPFLARKYAVQTPITPPPHTTTRFLGSGCFRSSIGSGDDEEQRNFRWFRVGRRKRATGQDENVTDMI
ncbi:hypothetical protein V6N13_103240 [Hibiscus sabdariffa]|uniref:Uncharacterized protein n=1 Tax=Hibiscus sabdariffa TaxID=183260 RepID=A0ABR2C5A4_9ROSI